MAPRWYEAVLLLSVAWVPKALRRAGRRHCAGERILRERGADSQTALVLSKPVVVVLEEQPVVLALRERVWSGLRRDDRLEDRGCGRRLLFFSYWKGCCKRS